MKSCSVSLRFISSSRSLTLVDIRYHYVYIADSFPYFFIPFLLPSYQYNPESFKHEQHPRSHVECSSHFYLFCIWKKNSLSDLYTVSIMFSLTIIVTFISRNEVFSFFPLFLRFIYALVYYDSIEFRSNLQFATLWLNIR